MPFGNPPFPLFEVMILFGTPASRKKNATAPRFQQQSTIRPISFSFEINSRLLGNL
jgi:hypothetical protein